MSYQILNPEEFNSTLFIQKVSKELDELGIKIKVPILAGVAKAYNNTSLMGVLYSPENTVFLIRRSDFWTVFSQRTMYPTYLFNYLYQYDTLKKEIRAPWDLTVQCENICKGAATVASLSNQTLNLQCYSKEAIQKLLHLFSTSINFETTVSSAVKSAISYEFTRSIKDIKTSYAIDQRWFD